MVLIVCREPDELRTSKAHGAVVHSHPKIERRTALVGFDLQGSPDRAAETRLFVSRRYLRSVDRGA
jgi:hypothetical protein